MQFIASARFIRYSPYKMRPLVDVVRGKDVAYALNWLATYSVQRATPVEKLIRSAAANAQNLEHIAMADLFVKEIRVDQGPSISYFKPGAMGRPNPYKKRLSHMKVVLAPIASKKD